jgi:5-methylcytosine-specific restriction enzyme subunit McrC
MNYTQCFEHDRLYRAGSPISKRLGVVELPASLFDWLLSQVGQPNGQWLRLDAMGRVPVLKAQQYAGVVRSPCGHVLEILPKTGHAGHTPAQARRVLLTMLSHLPDFHALQLGSAAVAHAQVPLLEVFIGLALTQFEQLLRRGVRSHYVSQHAQRPVLRGKLLMAEQLKHNIAHRERFYTEHDEYVRNRAENRLIRAALRCTLQ